MGASKQAVATADPPVADGPESAGSAAAKRLRSKGSGGIFLVRDGFAGAGCWMSTLVD